MALSDDERRLFERLTNDFPKLKRSDSRLSRYYEGLPSVRDRREHSSHGCR